MYARIVRFVLGPDRRWEIEHMAEAAHYFVSRLPGFIDVAMLHDYETGECHWISYWETEADAVAAQSTYLDRVLAIIGDGYQWPPVVQYCEVYTPTKLTRHD